MKRVAVVIASIALLANSSQPSEKLIQILTTISHFDDGSLIAISYWASYPNPQAPDMDLTDLDRVQTEALELAPVERDALFAWLDHGGRDKLLALGLSNAQIGPCQKLIDLKTCHTAAALGPSPAALGAPPAASETRRALALRLTPPDPASGIELDGGFAFVSGAATLTHCIGFRNTSKKTASAITFTYQITDAKGSLLQAGSDILVGSFVASASVPAPDQAQAAALLASSATSHLPSNCWSKTSGDSDPAMLRGTSLAVEVASVTYEDGTHWSL